MKTLSLELSKQLQKAGYPQEEHFYWVHEFEKWWLFNEENLKGKRKTSLTLWYYAAPTADELLDRLPKGCTVAKSRDEDKDKQYMCYMSTSTFKRDKYYMVKNIWGETATEVLAKMWLILKENNLISPQHEKEER